SPTPRLRHHAPSPVCIFLPSAASLSPRAAPSFPSKPAKRLRVARQVRNSQHHVRLPAPFRDGSVRVFDVDVGLPKPRAQFPEHAGLVAYRQAHHLLLGDPNAQALEDFLRLRRTRDLEPNGALSRGAICDAPGDVDFRFTQSTSDSSQLAWSALHPEGYLTCLSHSRFLPVK